MKAKKYKCISVKSLTYAQKAESILKSHGIDAYIIKQPVENTFGCARCVKIEVSDVGRSIKLLESGGVIMSGDIYDA